MGVSWSNTAPLDDPQSKAEGGLTITGLGTAWPNLLIPADGLEKFAERRFSKDEPWLKKLLKVNGQTGIKTRSVIDSWDDPMWLSDTPATIEQINQAFNKYAVPLATGAARKALDESGLAASSITHMVSVTATDFSCPGYDHLVAKDLGIAGGIERSLLSGSGCAGGLAALRVASNQAMAASARGKPARVLVVACELSSVNLRAELEKAHASGSLAIGGALFSDGASAVVLCNEAAMTEKTPRLFSMIDWCMEVAPGTYDEVSVKTSQIGFLVHLAKSLPHHAATSVHAPLRRLLSTRGLPAPQSMDWALHAGGAAIIKGVQESVGIPDHGLRATSDVYSNHGNTASVTVLAVLDRLRKMGPGTRDVIMCSFGPGLTVEMALLKRCS